jgi:hypothetical protein
MTIITIKVTYGMKDYEYYYDTWGHLELTQNVGDCQCLRLNNNIIAYS